jgi:hypothetical protein
VDTVIANGRVLKRGGKLVGIDVKALRQSASESLHRLRERAGGQWTPPPGGPRF